MMRDSISGATFKRIRGGKGLGDALYVRPIVEELVRRRESVSVLTDYPQVFTGVKATSVRPFERVRVEVTAHYVGGKKNPGTTQWQDVCDSAGIHVPLRIKWRQTSAELLRSLRERARNRPLVLVHGGRRPMGRLDGFGLELLPSEHAFATVLEALSGCFLVQVGRAEQLYPLKTSLDLNGSTSVSDLLDVAQGCDAVVAQCSFAIPLAEVFDKPLLAVWGARYREARELFVRQTSPLKVLSSPKDCFVMDDWESGFLRESTQAWAQRMREELTCGS